MNVRLYFGAKMVTFCIIHIGNRKIFLKHHSPRVPTKPLAPKCVLIFNNICEQLAGTRGRGGGRYPTAQKVTSGRART